MMVVELKPHLVKHVISGQQLDPKRYRVIADGVHVGYIAFREGSPLNFIRRTGPIEEAEIKRQVEEQMAREVGTSQIPDVPAELLQPPEEEHFDDFDES